MGLPARSVRPTVCPVVHTLQLGCDVAGLQSDDRIAHSVEVGAGLRQCRVRRAGEGSGHRQQHEGQHRHRCRSDGQLATIERSDHLPVEQLHRRRIGRRQTFGHSQCELAGEEAQPIEHDRQADDDDQRATDELELAAEAVEWCENA